MSSNFFDSGSTTNTENEARKTVDISWDSPFHTIGKGPTQAAAGNHKHKYDEILEGTPPEERSLIPFKYMFQISRNTDVAIAIAGTYRIAWEAAVPFQGKLEAAWDAKGVVIPEDGCWMVRNAFEYRTPDALTIARLRLIQSVDSGTNWTTTSASTPATHGTIGGYDNVYTMLTNAIYTKGTYISTEYQYLGPGAGTILYSSVQLLGPI